MNTSCVYDQADDLTGLLGHQLDRKGSFMDKDAILQYLQELNQILNFSSRH